MLFFKRLFLSGLQLAIPLPLGGGVGKQGQCKKRFGCLWTTTKTSMMLSPQGCCKGTHTLAVTNSSVIGVKTLSTREQSCLAKHSGLVNSWILEIFLLNSTKAHIISNYILIMYPYVHRSVWSSSTPKETSLGNRKPVRENHNQ